MKRISPGLTPQKEPRKLPRWAEAEKKGYDMALRFLQNAIMSEDEEGINMMPSVLRQLGAETMTLGRDLKKVNCNHVLFAAITEPSTRSRPSLSIHAVAYQVSFNRWHACCRF